MTSAPFPVLLDKLQFAELEVFTAVTVISYIEPCSPAEVNKRFERTYCLHLQGGTCFLLGFFFDPRAEGHTLLQSIIYSYPTAWVSVPEEKTLCGVGVIQCKVVGHI
jgi:hypothetical protein